MFFTTGDIHGGLDLEKLEVDRFDKKGLSKDDYVVICGDCGLVWNEGDREKKLRAWFDEQPYTTLFVDGNHENFELLNRYPVEDWNNGKVHRVGNSILHLMRGQVFEIDDRTFFTMGGATSVDRNMRVPGADWWPEEMPSRAEYAEAKANLGACGRKVDIVLTHCAPSSLVPRVLGRPGAHRDELTEWLEREVAGKVTYSRWFFGHYHVDMDIDGRHQALFDEIVEVS